MRSEFQQLMEQYPDLRQLYTHRLATLRHSTGCRASCKEDALREEILNIARNRFRRDNPQSRM